MSKNSHFIESFKVPMKKNPEYIETKSKRVQLLMQPSLHRKIKEYADEHESSVNEVIHDILCNKFLD